MLDGLEAVELKLSNVLKDNEKFRFDSEFFKKDCLRIEDLIRASDHIRAGRIIQYLTDYHANGSYEVLKEHVELLDKNNYALMVRTTDLERSDFHTDVKYINESAYNFLEKTKIYGGEIIVNKIGTNAGNVYLMPFLDRKVSLGMNQFMLKTNSKINNYYLYSFLISKLGNKTIKRRVNGAAPFSIDKESILSINIPIPSEELQQLIKNIIVKYFQFIEDSKTIFKQAENLFLTELDLLDIKLSEENISIKPLSESFGNSGRLDSEYYQPKYDELIKKIETVNHQTLGDIVSIKKSIEPGSEAYQEEGIPFVRVSNLTKFEITQSKVHLSADLFDEGELENLQPKKDTILLSKDGTVGIAYTVKDETNIITSGALLHLTLKNDDVRPEYLTLVLNSLVVQMQSERDAGGSIIKHWKPSEIEEVLIPIIDLDLQIQIEQKIKASFKLKTESKKLLDLAKQAVETAIEQDEATAIKLIEAYEK